MSESTSLAASLVLFGPDVSKPGERPGSPNGDAAWAWTERAMANNIRTTLRRKCTTLKALHNSAIESSSSCRFLLDFQFGKTITWLDSIFGYSALILHEWVSIFWKAGHGLCDLRCRFRLCCAPRSQRRNARGGISQEGSRRMPAKAFVLIEDSSISFHLRLQGLLWKMAE